MWINYSFLITISSFVVVWGYAPLKQENAPSLYNEISPGSQYQLLQDGGSLLDHFSDVGDQRQLLNSGNKDVEDLESMLPYRIPKQMEYSDRSEAAAGSDYDFGFGEFSGQPSIRDQEYLQHSSLWGHKYISGGAGETPHTLEHQRPGSLNSGLPAPAAFDKSDSIATNSNVKTDAVLPAYCNPPNPCPVGFTAEEGCLEVFENSAAFSRAYQASQECMCDTEHMFDCSNNNLHESDDLELEQSQQDFLNELRGTENDDDHRVIAKKFYNKRNHDEKLKQVKELAHLAAFEARQFDGVNPDNNPFLHGDKLPIAAKKGNRAL